MQEVLNSYATDPEAQQHLTELALNSPDDQGFDLQHGLIRLQGECGLEQTQLYKPN